MNGGNGSGGNGSGGSRNGGNPDDMTMTSDVDRNVNLDMARGTAQQGGTQ